MTNALRAVCAVTLMAWSVPASAQETYVLDLVDVPATSDAEFAAVPDERALLTAVPPRPPNRDVPWELPLTVSLVSLDKGTYVVGEDIVYEFIIHNVSNATIKIPRSRQVHLFDKDMAGAVKARFWLSFEDDVLGTQSFAVGSTYGSETVAGSLLLLAPGETVLIRAKRTVAPSNNPDAPPSWLRVVNLKTNFALHPVTGRPYGEVTSTNHIAAQVSNVQ